MLAITLCCAVFLAACDAARILGVFMIPSYSHQVVYQPIWKELSLKGHEVVVLTPNPLNDSTLTNLTEIDLSFSYDVWNRHKIASMGPQKHSARDELEGFAEAFRSVAEAQLQHPQFQQLIKDPNQQFDLMLVEYVYPVMYAIKDIFKCPMIGISSITPTGFGHDTIGNPNHPALNPDYILPYTKNLSFKERLISTVFTLLFKMNSKFSYRPTLDKMAQKYIGAVRPIDEIAAEVSLVIVNSNRALHNVKPLVPAYVEISGIHLKKPEPLPSDLQEYLDSATEGVIYFSLGSNIKSYLLPQKQINKFLNVFSRLPYKVLWKFEGNDLANKSGNIEVRKWLPQQDLLAHPNIKLFITQGGLQSLEEALQNKIPVLTVPFFLDQRSNAQHVSEDGAALMIDFQSFTEDELEYKIRELLTNPSYRNRMAKLGAIASDQPTPALEKAVWWIEYVLRHDGARHLKYGAVDMPFYQYFLIDVILLIAAVTALAVYVLLRIFKHVVLCYHIVQRALRSINIYGQQKSHSE